MLKFSIIISPFWQRSVEPPALSYIQWSAFISIQWRRTKRNCLLTVYLFSCLCASMLFESLVEIKKFKSKVVFIVLIYTTMIVAAALGPLCKIRCLRTSNLSIIKKLLGHLYKLRFYFWYTGLPTKDETSETTVRNAYCLFP